MGFRRFVGSLHLASQPGVIRLLVPLDQHHLGPFGLTQHHRSISWSVSPELRTYEETVGSESVKLPI
jgi:hypothetical protein